MGSKADVIIGSATVTYGGNDLGFIIGGVEFHYEPEYHETFVDSHTGVLKRTLIRERAYALVNMGESNTEKLADIIPAVTDGGTSLSVGDGTMAGALELVITPVDTDADPIHIWKAVMRSRFAPEFSILVVQPQRMLMYNFRLVRILTILSTTTQS